MNDGDVSFGKNSATPPTPIWTEGPARSQEGRGARAGGGGKWSGWANLLAYLVALGYKTPKVPL